MNRRSHATMLVAALFVIFFASTAWGVTLSLTASDTNLEPDDTFSFDIVISDATDIVGCTFTVRYPSDLVEPATSNPVTTEFFALFQDNRQGASPDEIYPWEKNTDTDGLVQLAGVYVDPDEGMGAYTGEQTLFTLNFVVKASASGPARITLEQTMLFNPDAGWGTDNNENGEYDEGDDDEYEGAPILIKANEPGSQDEFEVVLNNFTSHPYVRFAILSSGTDSDGDGISDQTENIVDGDFECCLDPNNRDTDGDGIWDGDEMFDDGDCEYDTATETNPCDRDTDHDGIEDGDEDKNENGIVDDGTLDPEETDPKLKDSDNDKADDGVEKNLGTGMLDDGSYPHVICIGEYDVTPAECHSTAGSVTAGMALHGTSPIGDGPVYFWIRQIVYDGTLEMGEDMLMGIEKDEETDDKGSLTVQDSD